MKNYYRIFLTSLMILIAGSAVGGEETIVSLYVPATKLEALETNVGSLVIKGWTEVGTIVTSAGMVSIKCREITELGAGRKERGLTIEISEKTQLKERLLIDADELVALSKALEYLNKIEFSVTSLNAFDAVYTTKGGFRIAAFGNRRLGTVQFSVRDSRGNGPPLWLTHQEMARLCGLIDQAKRQLESLEQPAAGK